MMWVDDKPFSNQRKRILDIDNGGIPKRAKLTTYTIKALDGTIKQVLTVPRKWRNVLIETDYQDQPLPLKFDLEGYSYVEVTARKMQRNVRVYLKDDYERLLDLLVVALDFCDSCKYPLNVTEWNRNPANEWLHYGDGGGAIASVFTCPFCSHGNIRWEREFLEEHPELADGLKLRR